MVNVIGRYLIIIVVVFFASCAMSLTPLEVNKSLPTLTKSKYITQTSSEEIVRENKCRYLVRGRKYIAPIGLTAQGDLKNGAIGIDGWVQIDGGNAYVLRSFDWVTLDGKDATQLHVEFDTMRCEQ